MKCGCISDYFGRIFERKWKGRFGQMWVSMVLIFDFGFKLVNGILDEIKYRNGV